VGYGAAVFGRGPQRLLAADGQRTLAQIKYAATEACLQVSRLAVE